MQDLLQRVRQTFLSSSPQLQDVQRLELLPGSHPPWGGGTHPSFLFLSSGALELSPSTLWSPYPLPNVIQEHQVVHLPSSHVLPFHSVLSAPLILFSLSYQLYPLDQPLPTPLPLFSLEFGASSNLPVHLHQLWTLSQQHLLSESLRTQALFYHLLDELLYCAHHQLVQGDQSRFLQICHYIQGHFSQPLSIDSLCHIHKVTANQLYSLFSKYGDRSPMDYVIHCRLRQAALLLQETHLSIQEIAFQVGYHDPQYFSRLFQQRMGLSPSAFRKTFQDTPHFFKG